jgi:hypothetical protein
VCVCVCWGGGGVEVKVGLFLEGSKNARRTLYFVVWTRVFEFHICKVDLHSFHRGPWPKVHGTFAAESIVALCHGSNAEFF